MCPENTNDWTEANQRYLTAAIIRIREHLEKYTRDAGSQHNILSDTEATLSDTPDTGELQDQDLSSAFALTTLCTAFGLSTFERDILLLCAGIELDSTLASLVASIHGDSLRSSPTFSLALAALPRPHWSALSPAAPLRRWRMIEVSRGLSLTSSPLRIDERILHYLTGIQYIDERLNGLAVKFQSTGDMTPSHGNIVRRITDLWKQTSVNSRLPVIQLAGHDPEIKKDIAAWSCHALGLCLYIVKAENIPSDPLQLNSFLRLWGREAFLSQSALLIDCESADPADKTHKNAVNHFVETANSIILIAAPEQRHPGQRRQASFDVPFPPIAEQRALWISALGSEAARLDGQLDHLTSQFKLSPQAIRDSCSDVLDNRTLTGDDISAFLWDACRKQARPQLEHMAERIEPKASWDDLVLPEAQKETLQAIAQQVRLRHRVYESRGFAAKSARGLGISALFAGASGTGKTLAAEVLANDLRLDLFRIDLSQVVNKYIGETEKNLKRVFDAAEAGGSILLFDEADALFGKRSEVKDSHDRYANIEVSYLLQRMESYRGLAILTTNMKEALDTAFLRRIRFIVQFPFPDAMQRSEIWRRIFPAETPTERLDPERLSMLHVAGGTIRNIALHAAFIAADGNRPVNMTHIRQAVKREYAKIEKQISAAEMAAFNG